MSKSPLKSTLNRAVALTECLSRAGLFPPGIAAGHDRLQIERGADLLQAAVAMWESSGESLKGRGRAGTTFRWLKDQRERGAALTVGMPNPSGKAAETWLAVRLVWWPDGICTAKRVGVASSRLGRRLDEQHAWFAVLRGACARQLAENREVLLTAAGTASARFVEHAAERFGVRVLRIEVPKSDSVSLRQWLCRIRVSSAGEPNDGRQRAFLSPPIPDSALWDVAATETSELPLRDRALVGLSDRILAFRVRRRGNLHQLLLQRLRSDSWPAASVYVALGEDLTASETAGELLDAGAVGWVVSERQLQRGESTERPASIPHLLDGPRLHHRPAPIVEPPPSDGWKYLTHCTRRRDGPWPEQSEADFLDALILERRDMAHSALASLARIVNDRCLRASKEGIRGGIPVVSFTAAPLDEIARLHVFRPHRGRWDFEPYGICILQDWLAERGARSVHYGNEQLWQSLSAAERPFFQVGQSVTSDQVMVWTAEREWRHLGDLDLRTLPGDAAFVFVPTSAEADQIAAISPWPVAVV